MGLEFPFWKLSTLSFRPRVLSPQPQGLIPSEEHSRFLQNQRTHLLTITEKKLPHKSLSTSPTAPDDEPPP